MSAKIGRNYNAIENLICLLQNNKKGCDAGEYKEIEFCEIRPLRNMNKRRCRVADLLLPENRELCDLFHHPHCRKNEAGEYVDGVLEHRIFCRIYYDVNGEIINYQTYCDLIGVESNAWRFKELNISYR